MPLDESLPDPEQHPLLPDAIDAAADLRSQPSVALHALQILEYALTAPAPRRHRTWLHRVSTALDALRPALDTQLHAHQDSIDLLAELASGEPDHAIPIEPTRSSPSFPARSKTDLRELPIDSDGTKPSRPISSTRQPASSSTSPSAPIDSHGVQSLSAG